MFTGLVWGVGRVQSLEARGGDLRLCIDPGALFESRPPALGDSIAINGVCLTVVELHAGLAFDVSTETLRLTSLGALTAGAAVNLEPALTLATPLGGHLLNGHVDALSRVLQIEAHARAQSWRFSLPTELARFVAHKGSIAVDGVSLTVNAVGLDSFDVMLIPHTIERTRFSQTAVGDAVNLEVDLLARYLDRLQQHA